MQFKTFNLYQKINMADKLKNEYELIESIDVCISVKSVDNIRNDTVYTLKQIIGLTKYSDLDERLTYKIVDGLLEDKPKQYDVTGIIFGRFNQLVLKEVIK